MSLDDWVTYPLNEFVGIANTLDYLNSIGREEREELYRSFRKLYDASVIGTKAKVELGDLQWKAIHGPTEPPEDLHERIWERIKQIPIPQKEEEEEEKSPEEIGYRLPLNDLMDLASSYLTEVSQYILTEAEIKNTTPQELILGTRIIYEQDEYDEKSFAFFRAIARLISKFVNSLRGIEYGGQGVYEFVDFGDYLCNLKEEEAN